MDKGTYLLCTAFRDRSALHNIPNVCTRQQFDKIVRERSCVLWLVQHAQNLPRSVPNPPLQITYKRALVRAGVNLPPCHITHLTPARLKVDLYSSNQASNRSTRYAHEGVSLAL